LKTIIIVLDEYCFYYEHDACLTLDANYANPLVSSRKLGHSSFQEMYLFLTFFDRK